MFFGSKCVKVVKMCILHIYKRAGVDALIIADMWCKCIEWDYIPHSTHFLLCYSVANLGAMINPCLTVVNIIFFIFFMSHLIYIIISQQIINNKLLLMGNLTLINDLFSKMYDVNETTKAIRKI